jgi:hypothetical protein
MTTYTAVLPWVYKPYRDAFMETCRLDVFEVDNSEHNVGLMRSHNLGVERMEKDGTEWLVVLSAALRFGPSGGLDFIDHLDRMQGHRAVEAMGVFGWHLIAFHRDTIDAIGRWDEQFTPYGFDDIDMSVRYQLVYGNGGQLWDKVPVDVDDAGMAHSIKLGGVESPAGPLIDYFVRKWGRHPGRGDLPTYGHPFNNPANPVSYWPEVAT